MEHNISLNFCFVLTLKQFATTQQYTIERQLAMCQNLSLGVNISKVYTIYICVCVWSIRPTLWSNSPSPHFAYVYNVYDIELGHMISALLGTLDIEGPEEKYFLPIAASCILRSNHWRMCKVVEPLRFSPMTHSFWFCHWFCYFVAPI